LLELHLNKFSHGTQIRITSKSIVCDVTRDHTVTANISQSRSPAINTHITYHTLVHTNIHKCTEHLREYGNQ